TAEDVGVGRVGGGWQGSVRSGRYARALWRCVAFAAFIWTVNFAAGSLGLRSSPLQTSLSARWPSLVISSFPFAIALTLPLLLNEDAEKPEIGWLRAMDILQFGIIVFSAFLVFFYIPSFQLVSDAQRMWYLSAFHVTRDSFLALGYLYRGWRSRITGLRRLHFRLAAFFVAYELPSLLIPALQAKHWPFPLLSLTTDVAPLLL